MNNLSDSAAQKKKKKTREITNHEDDVIFWSGKSDFTAESDIIFLF